MITYVFNEHPQIPEIYLGTHRPELARKVRYTAVPEYCGTYGRVRDPMMGVLKNCGMVLSL